MSRWALIFRAEGEGPPVEIRIRRLLKAALRCYGLRCIGYGESLESARKGVRARLASDDRPREK
jgi:hypothetical protein